MKNQICPKCGSTETVPFIGTRDYDASSYRPISIRINVPCPGESLSFRRSDYADVRALMCEVCGYTEFYAPDPRELFSPCQKTINKTLTV